MMNKMLSLLPRAAALALAGTLLAGCVYYPNNGYYAAAPGPVVVAPAPVVVAPVWGWGYGYGWGGGWHRGWR